MSWSDVTWRPISSWPGGPEPTAFSVERSPFSAPWTNTVEIIDRELWQIRAREVVLEAAFHEGQLRLDGKPYANAKARHPGVILSVGSSSKGPLRFPSGRFATWQDNVRAIALTLESLRRVDRYGTTPHAEQYAGWKALPSETTGDALIQRGTALIEEHGGVAGALKAAHPDHGGDPDDFQAVQAARAVMA